MVKAGERGGTEEDQSSSGSGGKGEYPRSPGRNEGVSGEGAA